MRKSKMYLTLVLLAGLFMVALPSQSGAIASLTQADQPDQAEDIAAPETEIEAPPASESDAAIRERLTGIFQEIGGFEDISITVEEGVVSLSGSIPDDTAAARAQAIAQRVSGVVTVEANFERDVSVGANVTPIFEGISESLNRFVSALPLILIAFAAALIIAIFGHWIASFKQLWKRLTPNIFLAELVATSVRVLFVGLGVFVALDILGATALIGAVLGGAGVIGLAVGFALRDTVDNYVSSIMLSIRQPFRANDHVLIGDHEGRVVRLTSRATILMTLDGNHLRIPNSTVFKAHILNYTRNAERRFSFDLGVDANDDPAAAIETGLKELKGQPFILNQPEATAAIQEVGDSNIIITFYGWVDQRESDFSKARGAAIRVVKNILEASGFALPEPIYRLRFDDAGPLEAASVAAKTAPPQMHKTQALQSSRDAKAQTDVDTAREEHVDKLVEQERASQNHSDLLDCDQPTE